MTATGGVQGRPIDSRVDNDQWTPELVAQVAAKLVKDTDSVALVGNGSFLEMTVMALGCAISERCESPNIVSTHQGPLPSSLGVVIYAHNELGASDGACINLNSSKNGIWSCAASIEYMQSHGGDRSMALLTLGGKCERGSARGDCLGADTVQINPAAGLVMALLLAAEEQDLRDAVNQIVRKPRIGAHIFP